MKFTIAALAALLSATALAAPIEVEVEERAEAAAASQQWTIQNMKRVCNDENTSCVYSFAINTHVAPATPCTFTVTGKNASRKKKTVNHICGSFNVGTGWVDQFGPNNGFTVLPTFQSSSGLEAYPSYSDADLNTEKVVKPDRTFTAKPPSG